MKVAVVQAGSLFLDLEGCLAKAQQYISEAAEENVNLVLFPEAFLSGYPRGLGFGTVVGSRSEAGREQWLAYWKCAVEVPSAITQRLGAMAKEAQCFLAIGCTERDPISKTLYCSLLYFGSDGALIGKHRKLKPTAAERIIWGEGDGTDLCTFDSPFGKWGGLICWENYMPLARMALYQKGIEIYLAPTADSRPGWQGTMRHIALEGRCFVLGCNQFVRKSDYPERFQNEIQSMSEPFCDGGSVIYSPLGKLIAEPLYGKEGLLIADLDLDLVTKAKFDFDPVGHYNRPDIFKFSVRDIPDIKKIPNENHNK